MASGFKFRIKEEKELYYMCIEDNGAVHLCHTADLRFGFAYAKYRFLGSYIVLYIH